MKRIIFCMLLTALITSCNNGDKKDEPVSKETEITPDVNVNADFPLLNKYDCGTCHKKDDISQGPSYTDIANKYAGKPDAGKYLSQKIIEGGSGVWGKVPMAAHTGMPAEDLNAIVAYILALKK